MSHFKIKQRSYNNKLCTPRVPSRHQLKQQQQEQQKKQQQQQQQLKQQVARRRCIRRVQPCLARASPAVGESADENGIKALNLFASPQPLQVTFSLDDELPTISAAEQNEPKTVKRKRLKRGYRIFYRPVSSTKNYYSVPFPPPESLRLECDGDESIWQDLEIRVISHAGIVVWHDVLAPIEEPNGRARTSTLAQRPVRRKFGPRAYGMSQPVHPKPTMARLQRQTSALLSIEATINHGLSNLMPPPPSTTALSALPRPMEAPRKQKTQRPTTTRRLIGATVSHSNDIRALGTRKGNPRPLYLMSQLSRMRELQLKDIKNAELHARLHWQQHEQLEEQARMQRQKSLCLVQSKPKARAFDKVLNSRYPLPKGVAQQSKIPQLKPNWHLQKKLRRQSQSRELPDEVMQRLRRKLLKKLRNFHRHSPADGSFGQQVSCGCRTQLPSYMRHYSPVLHYPTPSQLPVPITRGIRRSSGRVANAAAAVAPDTWGIDS